MKFEIVGKTFESPVIEAENAEEAIIQFTTNMNTNMYLYFKAIPAKECEPLMRITNIEWDLSDIEDDAEAYSINNNLPKSEDLGEFIEEDQVADYLSDKYGYCVKSFKLEDNSWNSAEAYTGIFEYHNADDLIIAREDVDGFEFDTVYMELDWAIRIATETPKYEEKKPKFSVGDEVRYTKTDVFCYVVKVPDDGGIRLYDTCNDSVIVLRDYELDSLVLEGHSEMAEKVFS